MEQVRAVPNCVNLYRLSNNLLLSLHSNIFLHCVHDPSTKQNNNTLCTTTPSVTACIAKLTVEVTVAVQDVRIKSCGHKRRGRFASSAPRLYILPPSGQFISRNTATLDHAHVNIPYSSARVRVHRSCCLTFQKPHNAAIPPDLGHLGRIPLLSVRPATAAGQLRQKPDDPVTSRRRLQLPACEYREMVE